MWLPAFKYIKGLLAQRGQFMLPNGQPYEGSYHKLYNGETYTGDVPSPDSIRIYEDDSEPHLPVPTYEDKLVAEQVHPDPEDYDRGFFMRYFIKDTRNGKIIEVKKDTSKKKLKEKYLKGTTIKWILEKPVKDIFNQGFLYKGAASRNKENTLKASLELKGIELYITEYDKFVNIESDVEGYNFEELSREERVRIIRKISSIQKTPTKKVKPRFKKKPKRIPDAARDRQPSQNLPRRSGGGGGGGGMTNEGIFDNNEQFGGFGSNDISQNNYY